MPRALMRRFVSGLRGRISGPSPRIKRSAPPPLASSDTRAKWPRTAWGKKKGTHPPGLGQTSPSSSKAPSCTSHWPFPLTSLFATPQGLAADKQRSAAVEDLDPVVQLEAVGHAAVDRRGRYGRGAEDVHAAEVGGRWVFGNLLVASPTQAAVEGS